MIGGENAGGGAALEAMKISGEFAGGLIAVGGIFFEALGKDVLEFGGELWIEDARRNRRAVKDGVEEFAGGEFRERTLARGHLVEDETGGVEIGARVEIGAEELFRGHVGKGASERLRFELRLRDGFGKRHAEPGETEIKDFEAAILSDEEIGGLEIAMNDGVIVGGDESIDKLKGESEEFGFGERADGEALAERLSGNVLHDEKVGAALSVEIVDGGDVGMIELGERVGFVVETMARGIVGDGAGMKKFEGNVTIEMGITGQVNDTHAAAADFALDAVVAEFETDEGVLR